MRILKTLKGILFSTNIPATPIKKCDGTACQHNKVKCAKRHILSMTQCTLPKGHNGPHIACGFVTHNIAVWQQ